MKRRFTVPLGKAITIGKGRARTVVRYGRALAPAGASSGRQRRNVARPQAIEADDGYRHSKLNNGGGEKARPNGGKKTRASANTSDAKLTAAETARKCVDPLSTPNEERVFRRTVPLPGYPSRAIALNGAPAG